MKVILIGNYRVDKQESMERSALLLESGFRMFGIECEIWRPIVFLGSLGNRYSIGKWLGYFDKWIIFPVILRLRVAKMTHLTSNYCFHICDHSNAPYLKHLPLFRTGITCNDVLAIRGALGYPDAYCEASGFGKIFQKWILSNLKRAKLLACISEQTLKQLKELTPAIDNDKKDWRVVYLALNAPFKRIERRYINSLLCETKINPDIPFILHVGSNLPRKNRKLLLEMTAKMDKKWFGNICYAGQPLEQDLLDHAASLGLLARVVSIVKPSHDTLVALYNACAAFIFPSFSEGMGWPIIEAQACGAPVIASNIEPMPEISGGAALHVDPNDSTGFAKAFISLQDENERNRIIEQGYQNCKRFDIKTMISSYIDLYDFKTEHLNNFHVS